MNGSLRGWLARFGVDRAVAYGILSRVASSASGLVTLGVIVWRFDPELQGYFYTFGNLVALQMFAELGLATVLIHFASHEWSRLRREGTGEVAGDPDALSRLSSLGRLALGWYGTAAVVVAAGLALGGGAFFAGSPSRIDWRGPWLALSALTGLQLVLLPVWALLEGCDQVAEVHLYRLVRALVSPLATWAAILGGLGLWALPIGVAVDLAWGGLFLGVRFAPFLRVFASRPRGATVGWRREVWPMQGRVAATWMAGYFVFHLFSPVLFRFHGPAVAGQWGMTWLLFSSVGALASLWITARVPRFGMWIARRDFAELDRVYARSAAISAVLCGAGVLAVWLGLFALRRADAALGNRALPDLPAALLAAATLLMQVSLSKASYLRAHKREPLFALSLVQAALTTATTFALGIPFGAIGMAAGYLAVVALLVVPGATLIWRRCRKEWHLPEAGGIT